MVISIDIQGSRFTQGVKAVLTYLGSSQKELAEELNVSRSYLFDCINGGRHPEFRKEIVKKLRTLMLEQAEYDNRRRMKG